MNYRFSVINNRHFALEYFFHYNHELNLKTCIFFKTKCLNNVKVYIFVMCKSKGRIWHVIHETQTLLKIWSHLTFQWPFVNISLYFCDHYHLTSNLIYMKNHVKHFEILTPIWPARDPYREGVNSPQSLKNKIFSDW